jgi:hypothetical protein
MVDKEMVAGDSVKLDVFPQNLRRTVISAGFTQLAADIFQLPDHSGTAFLILQEQDGFLC